MSQSAGEGGGGEGGGGGGGPAREGEGGARRRRGAGRPSGVRPGRGPRRPGRRRRRAVRAGRRGRAGPRRAGAGRAAGAAEEAGAGLLSPGRPHCSSLRLPFAVLRARPSRGRGSCGPIRPPAPASPDSSARAGRAPQVLLSHAAGEGFPTRDPVERRLYNVPLNWRKLGKPETHTLKEEGKQPTYVY